MKRPGAGTGTKIATGAGAAGTIGSLGWSTFAGGPVWVPIAVAVTTVLFVVVQAVLNNVRAIVQSFLDTVRDIAPQRSEHRLQGIELMLAHLAGGRRDRIKERRERAERKSLGRRPRTIVLVVGGLPGRARVQPSRRAAPVVDRGDAAPGPDRHRRR